MMLVDRLSFAKQLCSGKKVVDVGGSRMNPEERDLFAKTYLEIQMCASEYLVIDRHPTADVVMDLNYPVDLSKHLDQAEVVLCMETLEHLRNPGLVCDALRSAATRGAEVYVTIPRASAFCMYLEKYGFGNWWGKCHHLYSFPDYHADVFISDNFTGCNIKKQACLGKYNKLWPLVQLATFGRGLSHGFLITKN